MTDHSGALRAENLAEGHQVNLRGAPSPQEWLQPLCESFVLFVPFVVKLIIPHPRATILNFPQKPNPILDESATRLIELTSN
jgi:hypothetical protein